MVQVPQRIVSLLPSATEIVCAMGLGDRLVGRSHECDWPEAEVAALPIVTRSRIDASQPSAAIQRQVQRLAIAGALDALSIYEVDAPLLAELNPDLIITQDQCAVCAVDLAQVERAVGERLGSTPRILAVSPRTLEDVWASMAQIGEAAVVEAEAGRLVQRCRQHVDAISRVASKAPNRPRVACLEWLDPLMYAGHWTPQLVDLAGGRNLFGAPGDRANWLEWDAFHECEAEVIVLMPCGFDLNRARGESAELFKHPGFQNYRAVRDGRVYVTDGNHYFNRPGPRLVESLEILAEVMHPEMFRFDHEGTAWQRL